MPLIKSNQFAASVAAELYNYEKDVLEAMGKAVVETGKRSLRVVQSKSPVRSGEYKKSWKIKEVTTGIYGSQVSVIIHNKKYPYAGFCIFLHQADRCKKTAESFVVYDIVKYSLSKQPAEFPLICFSRKYYFP